MAFKKAKKSCCFFIQEGNLDRTTIFFYLVISVMAYTNLKKMMFINPRLEMIFFISHW